MISNTVTFSFVSGTLKCPIDRQNVTYVEIKGLLYALLCAALILSIVD